MAQIDGKQLQINIHINKWEDSNLTDEATNETKPKDWRIKPETEFPVYYRSKEEGFIAKFTDEHHYQIVMAGELNKINSQHWTKRDCTDLSLWEPIETVETGGQVLYDTQPVWGIENNGTRCVCFVNAEEKYRVFSASGNRKGWKYKNIEPIKHIEDWMIEAWKKLKI